MATDAPITGAPTRATPHAPPERLPLSQMALTAWQHDLSPDQLDMMAEVFVKTAAELRAIGMGEASHA